MPQATTVLSAQARRTFESIVGDRHVADDPAFMASYSWVTSTGGLPSMKQLYDVRPIAIVMPETTAQVQAIVRACRQLDLKFHAHSTGTASFSTVLQPGTVSLDLRRMNKIIQLDARNQMAVIEPYVTAQQLQAEAMKVGLTTHVIGAGWTHSPLASASSLGGIGITGNHTSSNGRNLLAWEWVTPEGEIVHSGSAGAGAGWFAGEGPGLGFRGMIRGYCGAAGGLGVFTRIGYKLHPWAGPAQLEHKGQHPQIGIALNSRMRLYHLAWNDWEGCRDALYEMMVSNASTFIVRVPPDQYGWMLNPTNRDYYDRFVANDLPEVARVENRMSWTLLVVSETEAEAAWRDRTIRAIVTATKGRSIELPTATAEVIARNSVTSCYAPRVYRGGPRQMVSSFGVFDSAGMLPEVMREGERLLAPYKNERKTVSIGGPEEFWTWPSEGRNVWSENIVVCDNDTPKSYADGLAYVVQSFEQNHAQPRGISGFALSPMLVDIYGNMFGASKWMVRIKKMLDPHSVSDGLYPTGEPNPIPKVWPFLRMTVLKVPLLLRLLMLMQLKATMKGGRKAPRANSR